MIVYLDANIYIGVKYNFNGFHMGRLVKLIEDGKVQLLVSKVTTGEVYAHIKEDITNEVNAYKRVIRKEMPIISKEDSFELNEINVDEAVEIVQNKARNFFSLTGVTTIPLNPLDVEKLMDDCFSMTPPFEPKKPNEFKDAIMINAIRNYQKSLDESVIIISTDKGVRKSFDGDDNFITFEKLSDFLEFYFEQFKELDAGAFVAKEMVEGQLGEAIKAYTNDVEVYFTEYAEWDIEDKVVNNIHYGIEYISQEEDKIYVAVKTNAEISVEIMYRDEDNSYYDKEENRYLFERYLRVKEKHEIDFEVGLILNMRVSNNSEIILDRIALDKSYYKASIELDEDTRIDSEIIYDSLNEYNDF